MGLALAAATASVLSVTLGATAGPSIHVSTSAAVLPSSGAEPTFAAANQTLASASSTTSIVTGVTTGTTAIQEVTLYNNSGVAMPVAVKHNDGTNLVTKFSVTMGIGYTITYDEGGSWRMLDANMRFVQALGPGSFIKRTVILNGTTTFTTSTTTSSIIARMVAGGGGGGGAPLTTGEHGSGGGGGSYAEWSVAVSPSTAYTCAVGAGGTGVSAANGNTGGVTTLAIGGTTVTCNGGLGGIVGNSATVPVLGGAGGAVSTNGTTNIAGYPGLPNVPSATLGLSGDGGGSPLGAGGQGKLAASAVGNAATGFGAGGGGAVTTGTAELGGAGSNGVIIIDEYT